MSFSSQAVSKQFCEVELNLGEDPISKLHKTSFSKRCFMLLVFFGIFPCTCYGAQDWEYENTGIAGTFDECAAVCERRSSSLACIENDEQNDLFLEKLNGAPAWVGLYQTPGTLNPGESWDNWQRAGCRSNYSAFFNQPQNLQCQGPLCAAIGFYADQWYTFPCWSKTINTCICQTHGNSTLSFKNDELKLNEPMYYCNRRTEWDYVLLVVQILVVRLPLLVYSVKLFFVQLQIVATTKKITGLLFPMLSGVVSMILFLMRGISGLFLKETVLTQDKYNITLYIQTSSVAFNQITLFLIWISWLEAAELSSVGVEIARKSWMKRSIVVAWMLMLCFPVFSLICVCFFFYVRFMPVAMYFVTNITNEIGMYFVALFGFYPLSWKLREFSKQFEKSEKPQELKDRLNEISKSAFTSSLAYFANLFFTVLAWPSTLPYLPTMNDNTFKLLESLPSCATIVVYIVLFRTCETVSMKQLLRLSIVRNEVKRQEALKRSFGSSSSSSRQVSISSTSLLSSARLSSFRSSWMSASYGSLGVPVSPHMPPISPKPTFLRKHDSHRQNNVSPDMWSISIANWIKFIKACMNTPTWEELVNLKTDGNINTYDMNDWFIKPWTNGSGASIALLMDEPKPAELMISYAWAGSILETLHSIESLVTFHSIPITTRIFFCSLCMYQPEDLAKGGLSIQAQLNLNPFHKIISSRPTFGMFVIHTTIYEVYERLWCVHEVDEGMLARINMRGLFDLEKWTNRKIQSVKKVKTIESQCNKNDRAHLCQLIESRGGFGRLDKQITCFREQMQVDLSLVQAYEATFGVSVNNIYIHSQECQYI